MDKNEWGYVVRWRVSVHAGPTNNSTTEAVDGMCEGDVVWKEVIISVVRGASW